MKNFAAKILIFLMICSLSVFARKVPHSFQTTSVNAISCLDALKDGVLASNESTFLVQKMKCRELTSTLELTAKNEPEREIYQQIWNMFLKLCLCRSSATAQPGAENFAACLTEFDALRQKAKERIANSK